MLDQQTLVSCLETRAVQAARPTWQWSQTWDNLFFAHWQVPSQLLRRHVPACLDIDTRNGEAWLSTVAFRLRVRPRWLPALSFCGQFLELNLRTYVRWRGERGMYFLSIHANKRLSVALARWLTPLPYVFAPIGYQLSGLKWHLACGATDGARLFDADFTPTGVVHEPASGSLNHWLLERYVAFASDCDSVYRMQVQHAPWSVQRATTHLRSNRLGLPWNCDLARAPDAAHFAMSMQALLWPFEGVESWATRANPDGLN